jgi:hypothetical protein
MVVEEKSKVEEAMELYEFKNKESELISLNITTKSGLLGHGMWIVPPSIFVFYSKTEYLILWNSMKTSSGRFVVGESKSNSYGIVSLHFNENESAVIGKWFPLILLGNIDQKMGKEWPLFV